MEKFSNRTKKPHLHWTWEESLYIVDIDYRTLFITTSRVSFLMHCILSHLMYFSVNFNKDKVLDNIIMQQAGPFHLNFILSHETTCLDYLLVLGVFTLNSEIACLSMQKAIFILELCFN